MILLQNSFFFPAGSFLFPSSEPFQRENRPELPANPENEFQTLLIEKDSGKVTDFQDLLFRYFDHNQNVLPNQAKDLYYKLFRVLEEAARQLKLTLFQHQENLMDTLENIFSFYDLHQKLIEKTEQFFQSANNTEEENSTIFLIKDYISRKYMDESLSVKDISEHVFLSASYVCTFFKSETGQTLNQYLTEYRMEKPNICLQIPDIRLPIFLPESATAMGIIWKKLQKVYRLFSV